MATAPALEKPGRFWHVRGSWSARDDRAPFAVYLAILWVGMIAGFGHDIPRFLHENPPAPVAVRVHAVVFTTWMFLLTAQVLLVLRDRVSWHRRLGWVAVGWACLMAVMGPWAAMASQAAMLHGPYSDPPFLAISLENIACFVFLLTWGISLRKNPAAHKRIMILATVAIADPGFSRISGWLIPTAPSSAAVGFLWVYYGNVLLVLLMAAWDWRRGRLMRPFVLAAAALLSVEFLTTLLYFWGPLHGSRPGRATSGRERTATPSGTSPYFRTVRPADFPCSRCGDFLILEKEESCVQKALSNTNRAFVFVTVL